MLKPLSTDFLIGRITDLAISYSGKERATKIGDIAVFTYGMREVFRQEDFDGYSQLEFEGKQYKAPKNYDAVLKSMYGNYMEPPPKEKRVTHHVFEAYWKD